MAPRSAIASIAQRLAELDPRDVFARLWARNHAEPPSAAVTGAFERLLAEVHGDLDDPERAAKGVMRILAIRGCNLASLAGEFEIDLAHGALGGAGVFAIVGPTGAGKSTLLDAMCVALFDRTPRLTNHSRVVVGRGDDDPTALGAQDVRTLLAPRRERGLGRGRLRERRLAALSRAVVGASRARCDRRPVPEPAGHAERDRRGGLMPSSSAAPKTETLEAIHQRLGLTFDQFRRSALLAQGEFAAFLRADGKDRSELLERMTGTEIYSQLSIAAHVQGHARRARSCASRQGAALAIAILSPEARAQAEAELVLAKQAQAATRDAPRGRGGGGALARRGQVAAACARRGRGPAVRGRAGGRCREDPARRARAASPRRSDASGMGRGREARSPARDRAGRARVRIGGPRACRVGARRGGSSPDPPRRAPHTDP